MEGSIQVVFNGLDLAGLLEGQMNGLMLYQAFW
jgi:hypothetical protein